MTTIDTLVQDVAKLFEGKTLTEHLAKGFGEDFSRTVTTRFAEYGSDREHTLRLSNVGWPLRKLWYSIKGFKGETLPADAKVKFLYGDLLETLFIFLCSEAGHTVSHQQEKVEVDGVVGHIDCIIDGVLIDVKSCSTPSFKKFKSGEIYSSDPFGYVAQLTGYKQALKKDRAGWLIIDKTLGHFDFIELTPPKDYDINKRIEHVRDSLSRDVEPDRCYNDKPNDKSGNYVLDVGCNYCEHKQHCWRDSNGGRGLELRTYYNGPRWFTKLVKEPRLRAESSDGFTQFPTKAQG